MDITANILVIRGQVRNIKSATTSTTKASRQVDSQVGYGDAVEDAFGADNASLSTFAAAANRAIIAAS
jgi:hypothetical protein